MLPSHTQGPGFNSLHYEEKTTAKPTQPLIQVKANIDKQTLANQADKRPNKEPQLSASSL